MPTLQEVKAQIEKVRAQLEIFKQFDEEIKKSEEEIEAIKAKKTGLQTFEDFKTINTKEKSIELLELIANYNETYKNTAKGLAEKLEKTGIEDVFDFLNSFPKYSNISKPYIPSGVFEYTGNQNCYLNPANDLAYFVNRINSFEEGE